MRPRKLGAAARPRSSSRPTGPHRSGSATQMSSREINEGQAAASPVCACRCDDDAVGARRTCSWWRTRRCSRGAPRPDPSPAPPPGSRGFLIVAPQSRRSPAPPQVGPPPAPVRPPSSALRGHRGPRPGRPSDSLDGDTRRPPTTSESTRSSSRPFPPRPLGLVRRVISLERLPPRDPGLPGRRRGVFSCVARLRRCLECSVARGRR